jgi:hypothetical protein
LSRHTKALEAFYQFMQSDSSPIRAELRCDRQVIRNQADAIRTRPSLTSLGWKRMLSSVTIHMLSQLGALTTFINADGAAEMTT